MHICGELSIDDDMPTFASLAFEKEFNLVSCKDDYISTNDMTLSEAGGKLFFYQIVSTKEGKSGKDMSALKTNAPRELTEAMNSFKERCDMHRPGSNTIRANRTHIYMSRIDKPLKKSNNDKGEVKLLNHTRVLNHLGDSWISKYVTNRLFVVDLLDIKNRSSHIEKSQDYHLFLRPTYTILTQSTLYKLENYFSTNKQFMVDKKKQPIKLSVLPNSDSSSIHLPNNWVV